MPETITFPILPADQPVTDDSNTVSAPDPHATITAPGGQPDTLTTPAGFELLAPLGSGGMGEVFRARDLELDREVAVKVLHTKYAPDSPTAQRFVGEVRITARLQHPGIPPVYRTGEQPDGRPFLAMKLVEGKTLDVLLNEQGPGAAWLGVFEAICQAVGYAHTQGVVHRDLKPANVMIGSFGEVQVMDWGLAKVLGEQRDVSPPVDTQDPNVTIDSDPPADGLTRAGSILGSPAFMAPEQAVGDIHRIDRHTDVFGLGAILCTLLTGKPPYSGDSAESTRQQAARAKLTDTFARLDASGAEAGVASLCKWCLSEQPADRPADAAVVAKAVAGLRRVAVDRARHSETEAAIHSVKGRDAWRFRLGVFAAVILITILGFIWWGKQNWREQSLVQAARDDAKARIDVEYQQRLKAYQRRLDEAYARFDAESTANREAVRIRENFPDFVRAQERQVERLAGLKPLGGADAHLDQYRSLWNEAEKLESSYRDRADIREEGHRRIARLLVRLNRPVDALREYRAAFAWPPDQKEVADFGLLDKVCDALWCLAGELKGDVSPRLPELVNNFYLFEAELRVPANRAVFPKVGWYTFACIFSVASANDLDRKKDFADQAMKAIHVVGTWDFDDLARLKADKDLDPLRERDDFKKLLAELEEKFPQKMDKPGEKK